MAYHTRLAFQVHHFIVVNLVRQLPHITPSSVFSMMFPSESVLRAIRCGSEDEVRLFGAQVNALARAALAATSSTSGSRGVIVPLRRLEDDGDV